MKGKNILQDGQDIRNYSGRMKTNLLAGIGGENPEEGSILDSQSMKPFVNSGSLPVTIYIANDTRQF